MAICDVKELACYVSDFYEANTGKKISPICLQKSLYFLFAYWGGFVRKAKIFKNSVEDDYSKYDEELFEAEFEAWAYGPVVPVVYREKNISKFRNNDLFKFNPVIKDFVDGILKDLIEISEFNLIDISHKDLAWKNHFNPQEDFHCHNEQIPHEEIILEYARK